MIAEEPLTLREERLALAALTMGAFALSLNNSVLGPLLPYLRDQLHTQGTEEILLAGAASLAGALGALLLGPWVDRVGRRPPLVIGITVFAAASACYLVAGDFWSLLAARLVSGFSVGVVYTAASAAVADLVPYARRGGAMGVFSAGNYLAAPIGFPIAQALAEGGSWRGIFAVQAVFALFVLTCFWKLLRPSIGRGGERAGLRRVLAQPMVVPALLSVTLYVGCVGAVIQWLATWLDDTGIVPKDRQLVVWIVLGLCGAIGSFWLARFSDRFGKRRFVLATTLVAAFGLVGLVFVRSLTDLLVIGVPFALLVTVRTGPLQALTSELVPTSMRGTLMGIRAAGVSLGIGVCTLGTGALYRAGGGGHGGFGWLIAGAAAVILVSWATVQFWVREQV